MLLVLNVGCFGGTDCGPFSEQYLDVVGLGGNGVLIGRNYSDFTILEAGASVTYSDLGIRAEPEAVYGTGTASLSGGFLAYACSPIPPQPSEEIVDIAVFSSADYAQAASDKVFPAGDTLNAIIKIYDTYSGRIVGLPDFLVDDELMASDEPFTLQLEAAPREAEEHRFTVHYRLNNGEFYQFSTPEIMVTP